MKTKDKYRYTIQFKADTDANRRVGEALELLGNRKSAFIVAAISEYLDAHPDQQTPRPAERAVLLTKNDVKKLILSLLKEMNVNPEDGNHKNDSGQTKAHEAVQPVQDTSVLPDAPEQIQDKALSHANSAVDEMLNNLSLFM